MNSAMERAKRDGLLEEFAGKSFAELVDIEQILGVVLGYPWYKDDQENFPGSTEENGVCVGDHTPVTLAMEAAGHIERLRGVFMSIMADRRNENQIFLKFSRDEWMDLLSKIRGKISTPEWITTHLPLLELSLSNGYSWRSKRVFIWHPVYGRCMADLRATENFFEKWWVDAGSDRHYGVEEIDGWMPLKVLPDCYPPRPMPWLLHEENQRLFEFCNKEKK